MTDRPAEPDIHLTLRPLPDTVPVAVRLRHVLKRLLRDHRFRCIRIDWHKAPEDAQEGEQP